MKKISMKKVDREGHSADVVADAVFRFVMGTRFRRRGEKQVKYFKKLLEVVVEGHGDT